MTQSKFTLTRLLLMTFLAGIVDLAMQILAGRMLTPFFGSSVYTWGSVIGVFMITLALGYYVGGIVSEKAKASILSTILLFATAFIALLGLFGQRALVFFDNLGLPSNYAAIPAVLLLFGPASFFIGMLTPIVVEFLPRKKKGDASGKVFAFGTIGSIFGAFGATFILIPYFSLSQIIIILGVLLLITALLVIPRKTYIIAIVAVGLLLLSASFIDDVERITIGESVYQTQTPYQALEVRDYNGVRNLYLDGQLQSGMKLDDILAHVYSYTSYFEIPLLLNPDAKDILFIGGGGFSGPRIFAERGLNVDVVELDPTVAYVGQEYFFVDDSKMNIFVDDGREFLSQTNKTYDIIYLDAYRKDRVPFHLATIEFYALVSSKLNDDGILMSNLIAIPDETNSLYYETMYKTMQSVFPRSYAFLTRDHDRIQNIELIATKSRIAIPDSGTNRYGKNLDIELGRRIETVSIEDAVVLTDQKAPLDVLLKSIADEEFALS